VGAVGTMAWHLPLDPIDGRVFGRTWDPARPCDRDLTCDGVVVTVEGAVTAEDVVVRSIAAAVAAPSAVLLDRVTYGLTPALAASSRGRTARQWLDAQLDPATLPDPEGDDLAARWVLPAPGAAGRARVLGALTAGRAVWSRRQLLERVTALWTAHLGGPAGPDAAELRPHALGAYRELLRAAARDDDAGHPATADRAVTALCRHFLAGPPTAALAHRAAAAYRRHDTAVAPVLRELLLSPEFDASAGRRHRSPAEQLYAAVRALGVRPSAAGTEGIARLHAVVQELAAAPAGSGGAASVRRDALAELVAGRWPGLDVPSPARLLPDPLPPHHGGLVAAVHRRLHTRPMRGAALHAACAQLGVTWATPLTARSRVLDAEGLPRLVLLVLDAPALDVD